MKKLMIIAVLLAASAITAFADIAALPEAAMYDRISPVVIVIITAAICTVVVRIVKKAINKRR